MQVEPNCRRLPGICLPSQGRLHTCTAHLRLACHMGPPCRQAPSCRRPAPAACGLSACAQARAARVASQPARRRRRLAACRRCRRQAPPLALSPPHQPASPAATKSERVGQPGTQGFECATRQREGRRACWRSAEPAQAQCRPHLRRLGGGHPVGHNAALVWAVVHSGGLQAPVLRRSVC